MELHDALGQIAQIRQQMARTQVFRGYRAASTGVSGLVAMLTAGLQAWLIPSPAERTGLYLLLWMAAAAVSIAIIGSEIVLRHRRCESALQREITLAAVEQFVPTLVAGGLLTLVLFRFAPETLWMLPGLWAICCSLGIFASRRMLPSAVILPAGFYLVAGLACLALANGPAAFSPWAMALSFGLGQFLAAGVLYLALERNHG